jgi:dihydroorotate dehydrogenase electron transfer subunit
VSGALEVELGLAAAEPGRRTLAPFGRRLSRVVANDAAGPYRLVEAEDEAGPTPLAGQFYMLAGAERWGDHEGRPYLARAFSVCRVQDARLGFLVDPIGPGTARLAALAPGDGLWIVGPLGLGFSMPDEARGARDSARPLLVGGGIGIAPLVIWSETLVATGVEPLSLIGFRSAGYCGADGLLRGSVRLATDDGSAAPDGRPTRHGLVTELLEEELEREPHTVVYACGPPPMLEAVRRICASRSVAGQLALEAGMACGFGACYGCVVKTRTGYRRLCVDGPVVAAADLEASWSES